MYDIENYYNAETIKEAVTLLKEHPDARVISGASSNKAIDSSYSLPFD